MRYGDLIQFEPIETVVQLRDADRISEAERLVSTYVISEEMADRLQLTVLPNLSLESYDSKGLLIVGNYGTGKSHLMSVISAIAEHAEMVKHLTNEAVAEAAAGVAGKFKVVRTEIGTTKMSLRNILVSVLEEYLGNLGIEFSFPPMEEVINTKTSFEEMMDKFSEHPECKGKGLLIVVDELLDYLRGRTDQEINLDLSFLREIGEVCKDLPLRFVAGLQEMLFDNPRFSFVAGAIRRVKDRFDQVLIAARDIKYVVAERLLKKSADQKAKIRDHLTRFARFYSNMNERLDEYTDLFPVHPDYIQTFSQVSFVEKREILKTLSLAMRRKLNDEIDDEDPGLISYDQYWTVIKENAAFKTIPEIREVAECSAKLEGLFEIQYKKVWPPKSLAMRIIHGLSLHRLTVGDIESPVGLTAEVLRDSLCLYDPEVAEMGGDPADDLRGAVETALREVSDSVNGQFISATERDSRGRPSGMFYLDIKKTTDYDTQINKRASSLDKDVLDRAYFRALAQVMMLSDRYYPGTHLAWEYELEWPSRRASRIGYMFFGPPHQRSTAHPPRDFFIFFIQPFGMMSKFSQNEPTDVFFHFNRQADIEHPLRRYAAALDLGATSSGKAQDTYAKEANKALKELTKWLQENLSTAFNVTYRGQTKSLPERIKGKPSINTFRTGVRDIINAAASYCLEEHFQRQAPNYPEFSVLITNDSIDQAAQDALRYMRGTTQTRQATAVLDALDLLDGDRLTPDDSQYAQFILSRLQAKGQGQVLNRDELIRDEYGIDYMVEFRLEPQWLVVVLAVLVYNGDIVLAIPGKKFDANNLDALIATPISELVNFKHVEQPKDWNIPVLKKLFELVGLEPGKAVLITQPGKEAEEILARQFRPKVSDLIERIIHARQLLPNLAIWGQPLIPDENLRTLYHQTLGETKGFLETLQAYNTPAKFKNFRLDSAELKREANGLDALQEVEYLLELLTNFREPTGYISQACMALPEGHPWLQKVQQFRTEFVSQLMDPEARRSQSFQGRALRKLEELRRDYIKTYSGLHSRGRLGSSDARERAQLAQDKRWGVLRSLAQIDVMPRQQLLDYENQLKRLQECSELMEQDLRSTPICPHCGFRPVNENLQIPVSEQLALMDEKLEALLDGWTRSLLANLKTATVQESVELLSDDQKALIQSFEQSERLPAITPDFIHALQEALEGLEKQVIQFDDLKAALLQDGSPITVEELKKRFKTFVDERVPGLNSSKIRIVLE
jgi:energy-coupling factor transporter ATP-binding protein EcfA2